MNFICYVFFRSACIKAQLKFAFSFLQEILLCKVNFKNELIDRRVILYLNNCGCGRKYCRERAACLVKNQLKKVSLKDTAVEFMIEYALPPYIFLATFSCSFI